MDIERIISGLGGAVSGGIALGAAADFIFRPSAPPFGKLSR